MKNNATFKTALRLFLICLLSLLCFWAFPDSGEAVESDYLIGSGDFETATPGVQPAVYRFYKGFQKESAESLVTIVDEEENPMQTGQGMKLTGPGAGQRSVVFYNVQYLADMAEGAEYTRLRIMEFDFCVTGNSTDTNTRFSLLSSILLGYNRADGHSFSLNLYYYDSESNVNRYQPLTTLEKNTPHHIKFVYEVIDRHSSAYNGTCTAKSVAVFIDDTPYYSAPVGRLMSSGYNYNFLYDSLADGQRENFGMPTNALSSATKTCMSVSVDSIPSTGEVAGASCLYVDNMTYYGAQSLTFITSGNKSANTQQSLTVNKTLHNRLDWVGDTSAEELTQIAALYDVNGQLLSVSVPTEKTFGNTALKRYQSPLPLADNAENGEYVFKVFHFENLTSLRPISATPSFSVTVVDDKQTAAAIVRQNIKNGLLNNNGDPTTILAKMQADGSFNDIDYTDRSSASWKPYTHLERLKTLTAICYSEQNPNYGSEQVQTAIVSGLTYWYINRDTIYSNNWWYNDRAVPEALADILFFQPQGLSEESQSYFIAKAMERYIDTEHGIGTLRSYSATGQGVPDRLNQSLKLIFVQGLSDEAAYAEIERLHSYLNTELTLELWAVGHDQNVNDTQSIRADYSYQEHGNLLLTGSYGRECLGSIYKYLNKLAGTGLNLSEPAATRLGNVLLAFSQSQRKGYMDITVMGRAYGTRGDTLKPAVQLSSLYQYILSRYPDCANAAALQAQLTCLQNGYTTPVPADSRYFWQSDYLTHNRSEYHFSVRSASARSKTSEYANGQGYLGRYLGDGVMNLTKSGTEYEGLPPVLDWHKLPGTTVNQAQGSLLPDVSYGNSDVVGGVSDGLYSMQMFTYQRDGVAAKKAWFAFDAELVALGSGIRSAQDGEIFTTLNQCALNGAVTVKTTGNEPTQPENGERTLAQTEWVLHDGVGYLFVTPTDVLLKNEAVTGNWSQTDINDSGEDEVTKNIFLLGQTHGERPTNASYAYMLLPEITEAELSAYENPVSVLNNSEQLQAVWHSGLSTLQAAFYEAGTVTANNHTVSVNGICALMLTWEETHFKLYVSNPKNEALHLTVTVDGQAISFNEGIGSRGNDGGRTYCYDSQTGTTIALQ